MSLDAMVWVLRYSEATLGSRLVLLALADYAHGDGTNAFPAVENLALHCRMTRRAVQTALRKLEAEGHIEQSGRRPSGTIVYTIRGVGTTPQAGPRTFSTDSDVEQAGGEDSTRGVVDDRGGVVHDVRGVVDDTSMSSTTPDPSVNSENSYEKDPPLAPPEDGGGDSEQESARDRFIGSVRRQPRWGPERESTSNGRGRTKRTSRRGSSQPAQVQQLPLTREPPETITPLDDPAVGAAAWERVVEQIRTMGVDEPVIGIWLTDLTVAGVGADGAFVLADEQKGAWVRDRFGRMIATAAESVGVKVRVVPTVLIADPDPVSEVRPVVAG